MTIPTYLLFLIGVLGAADILLYHAISHGIRSHQDSRAELIVHSLRGPTYAILFLVVPNLALYGACFWALVALLAVDALISMVDFALEGQSRHKLGGLPAGEYVLHMVIAMIFGALVASVFWEAGSHARIPTACYVTKTGAPELLRIVMAVMAPIVLYSAFIDARAAWRLGKAK
jgi:hypothetical protein